MGKWGSGEVGMSKLSLIAPLAFASLGFVATLIEPAFAVVVTTPAPIVGAGLPALAILGGGYWLIRKLRGPR
jgi:hypothetical protein